MDAVSVVLSENEAQRIKDVLGDVRQRVPMGTAQMQFDDVIIVKINLAIGENKKGAPSR